MTDQLHFISTHVNNVGAPIRNLDDTLLTTLSAEWVRYILKWEGKFWVVGFSGNRDRGGIPAGGKFKIYALALYWRYRVSGLGSTFISGLVNPSPLRVP